LQSRSEAAARARTKAQEQIAEARTALEHDKQEALSNLQTEAGRLAGEIVRTVLRPVAALTQVGGR
jgi:F0F1-type ATP synthase membrane subunit b/b'